MKRWIHASFDVTMPDWLRKAFTSSYSRSGLKDKLMKKYQIALDQAQFLDHATKNSLPVYLMKSDYGTDIYIPGINDDSSAQFNGRNRKFGAISKALLPQLAADVVYLDLDDFNNVFDKREPYRDPRYSYRRNDRGDYAGQYKRAPYIGNGEYGPEEWSRTGMTPSNESRSRDKSGYKVPSPEQKIADYYTKFPQRMTDKVDAVYDSILEVKQDLLDADFNGPFDSDRRYNDAASNIASAYRTFSEVISRYRNLLSFLNSAQSFRKNGMQSDYYMKEFSQTISYIKSDLKEIRDLLAEV